VWTSVRTCSVTAAVLTGFDKKDVDKKDVDNEDVDNEDYAEMIATSWTDARESARYILNEVSGRLTVAENDTAIQLNVVEAGETKPLG
jgi:chromosome condensin MukBEF complex kleisin-like MukF subunit